MWKSDLIDRHEAGKRREGVWLSNSVTVKVIEEDSVSY